MSLIPKLQTIKNRATGYSLVELVTVIAVSTLVFGFISTLIIAGVRQYALAGNLSSLSMEADLALKQVHQYIRQAVTINTATSSQLNLSLFDGRSINFGISGNTLSFQRSDITGTFSVTTHLNTASFSYFDNTLATTTVLNDIKVIILEATFQHNESQQRLIDTSFIRSQT